MTLFWHNHFVSSQQKVRFARLMYAQNATLRAHALGSFATLLHAASKEPAMLIYLDVAQSRRGQPNENFAREVMELFTLGEGPLHGSRHQGSGPRVHRLEPRPRNRAVPVPAGPARRRQQDGTGRTGRFDGDAVLDVLLERPSTAEHIAAKLWREFVGPEPDPGEVADRAGVRASGYDIKARCARCC